MGIHNFDIKYRYNLISLYKLPALLDFILTLFFLFVVFISLSFFRFL